MLDLFKQEFIIFTANNNSADIIAKNNLPQIKNHKMHTSIHEKDFLEFCYSMIEKRCEWGSRENWKNSNFEELSFRISKASGIRVSPGTLKRMFGKVKTPEDYTPQEATKDALAKYLGHANWRQFKEVSYSELEQLQPKTREKASKSLFQALLKSIPLLFFIIPLALLFWITIALYNYYASRNFEFTGRQLTGKAYHTAIFKYDIQKTFKSVSIDFGDGKSSQLSPEEQVISHYYMLPGRYHVEVKMAQKKLWDTAVYITTDGWELFSNVIQDNIRYYPVRPVNFSRNDVMTVDPAKIQSSGVDTSDIYWTHFCNMRSYDIKADDLIFETVVKNDKEIVAVRCNHIMIDLVGKNGMIRLYFLKPGCTNWVKLQFSEISINGGNHDLSMFGKDFSDWRNVKLVVENQHAQVFYENTKIYEKSYQQALEQLYGIRYSFTGCGAVSNIKVTKPDGKLIYKKDNK